MFVSVSERTKEIGLRKAIGANNKDILFQFIIESVFVCCAGGHYRNNFWVRNIFYNK
ncbi:MAG: FtsX-like permease family protein [Endomicrobium sp.]|nr:FtsX-like permease family protein [Endomicrobium sp.]